MIIIAVTYLDESMGPTTVTSANGDIFSLRDRVHRVYLLHPTLESAIFEGFIIYLFALLNNIFTLG